MNSESNIWYTISWLFGMAIFTNGVLNVLRGNDPGLGVSFIILSFIYIPSVNSWLKKEFGFSIQSILQIVLGILITWKSLAVGAISEGYYPEFFDEWEALTLLCMA